MRVHGRGWCRTGTPIVLLTIEVADELVLLSDFDYWHCVLNDGEIILPYDDAAVYSEEEKRKSWENIRRLSKTAAYFFSSFPSIFPAPRDRSST